MLKTGIAFIITIFISMNCFAAKKKSSKKIKFTEKIEKLYNAKKYNRLINEMSGKWSIVKVGSLSYLASAYKETKQVSQQIKVLEFLKAKHENQFIWYYKLGLAYDELYLETKKTSYKESATKNFRKAVDLNPNFKPAYNALLKSFAKEGNLYEGRTIASTIQTQFGASPEVNQSLCKLYSLDGYIQEAKSYCSQAIESSPKFGDSHMYLANAYLDQGNKPKAKKIFAKAAQDFKKSEFVQVTVGDFNYSEGLYRSSYKNYQRAISSNKENKHAQVGIAQSLFKLQKPKRALAHYVKACKIDPRLKKEFKVAIVSLLTSGQEKIYTAYENSLFKCHQP